MTLSGEFREIMYVGAKRCQCVRAKCAAVSKLLLPDCDVPVKPRGQERALV